MTADDRARVQRWWITKPIVEDAAKFNRQFEDSASRYQRLIDDDEFVKQPGGSDADT